MMLCSHSRRFLIGDLFGKFAARMKMPLLLTAKKISEETSCSHLLNIRLHPRPARILTLFSS